MSGFQESKKLVLEYFSEMEKAGSDELYPILQKYVSDDYDWKGVYPFREITDTKQVCEQFWAPLKKSLSHLQRRQDIFIAGINEIDGKTWVTSMGNFMGLFDEEWLHIRPTGKMINLRYVEFSCVENGKITQTVAYGRVRSNA